MFSFENETFSLCFGLPSTLRRRFCQGKHSPKWINLKTLFLRCNVDCENEGFWKRSRMFSQVTHIVPIDIYAYAGLMPVVCYSLSHYCYRCVTLYTLHITVLQRWLAIAVCGKTWGQLCFRSFRLYNREWVRPENVSEWWDIFLNKMILPEELHENISCLFRLYRLSELFWGFTRVVKRI